MTIDYNHATSLHTLQGAAAALSTIFRLGAPKSLLDVGCGTGTWLRAAIDLGTLEVLGVDGIAVPEEQLHVARTAIELRDLSSPFNLGRRFDVALCLEVGEHMPESSGTGLISSIVAHSDTILFSAACPGQPGQHHVNCQWPSYWQTLFNGYGYVCDDSVRWQIWDDTRIEPWYRQNIFWARRDPRSAGREPRLKAVIHPEFDGMIEKFDEMIKKMNKDLLDDIEQGRMRIAWYIAVPSRAMVAKLLRFMHRKQ
jgi:SAM-dependent methyltransferase